MSGETYVGTIDQGTTGTRFMVLDHDGKVAANAYEKHEQIYPEPGWVEHDADETWNSTKQVIDTALLSAGLGAEQLEAIGITNQRKMTFVWDRETGQPVHNVIIWQDRRMTDRIEALEAEGETDDVRAKTGLELDVYFSVTKVEWLLDNSDPIKLQRSRPEDIRDRAIDGELAFGTIDTWFIYNLAGNHITDVTNASRIMLFNIYDTEWDDELLNESNVPRELLPEVRPSSDDGYYGTTDADGFPGVEVPIVSALGDQQAVLFGQTCFDAGDAKNIYDTGSFMLMNTGDEVVMSEHGLLTTIGFQCSGEPVQYALGGSVFIMGAAAEWFKDMTLIDNATESEKLARSVKSADGVYFVPASTGLGVPHRDQRARGIIVGMIRGTRREHIVRAMLESIAFQMRDVTGVMKSGNEIDLSSLRVDGGAVKNNFLCQLQSNILDTETVRPQVDETTALGAAYATGFAVGYWETFDEPRENWQVDRKFAPKNPQNAEHRYGRWKEAVDCLLDWAREE